MGQFGESRQKTPLGPWFTSSKNHVLGHCEKNPPGIWIIDRLNPSLRQSPGDEHETSRVLGSVRRYGRRRLGLHIPGKPGMPPELASLLPAAPLLPLLQQDTTSSSGAAAQLPRCLRALRGMRGGTAVRLCEPIAPRCRPACRGVPGDKNLTGRTAFSSRSTRSATVRAAKASRDSGRSPAGGAGLRAGSGSGRESLPTYL